MDAPKLAIAKQIRLAPVTEAAVPAIIGWAEKPRNAEFFRRLPPLKNWLDLKAAASLWSGSWIVLEDDQPVGLVTMSNIDQAARSCEYGILVDKDDSLHAPLTIHTTYHDMMQHAFDFCNMHKVYVKILDHRDKLKKIAEAIGFVQEATLRDSIFFQGEYRNEILLSCLKLEYRRP